MKPADAALCVLVMSIWASNVVAARFTVLELPGWFTITIRMLIIAVTLVPFVRFPRRHIGKIAALSVTMGTGHFGLMYVALQNISGGAAALILQTAVPFAAILAWLIYREPLGWIRASAIAFSFSGIFLLVGEPAAVGTNLVGGVLLALLSSFCFALANIQLRGLGGIGVFSINGWMSVFAIPQMALLSLLFEDNQFSELNEISMPVILALFHMGIVVSVLGHGLWYRLVPQYQTNQTIPFTLLIPVFGVGFGAAILGEDITWRVLAGGLMTVAGVAGVLYQEALKRSLRRLWS